MGTLACSDIWARAMMAAMVVAEAEKRAQSAPPARTRAAGSVDANPAAPKRSASVPKKAAQSGQAARVPERGAEENLLEPAPPSPVEAEGRREPGPAEPVAGG
eukprot:10546616-Alexandrium_andersonii.AAC.1